jgi:hypothetical protein
MALELVTGRAGKAHVDSADVGAFNAYTIGADAYVLNGCECSITDSNHVHISAGELLVNGRHVRVTGTGEDVIIPSGSSSYDRLDIIALHYKRDSDDVETIEFVDVQGTPVNTGTDAPEPDMPVVGSILSEDTEAYVPLWSVSISGLTPQKPTSLMSTLYTFIATKEEIDELEGRRYFDKTSAVEKQITVGSSSIASVNFSFSFDADEYRILGISFWGIQAVSGGAGVCARGMSVGYDDNPYINFSVTNTASSSATVKVVARAIYARRKSLIGYGG